MKQRLAFLLILVTLCLVDLPIAIAQSYGDGPIQLQIRLRDVRIRYSGNSSSDLNLSVGSLGLSNFEDDELTIFIWAQDNSGVSGLGWQGGTCRQPSLQMLNGGPDFTPDYNTVLFNYTYPTNIVPQYASLRLDAWEDDVPTDFALISGVTACGSTGSRCTYETSVCCLNLFGCLFDEEDDLRCNANPFQPQLDYRLDSTTMQRISPCLWFDHGYVQGSGCTNNFYRPRIETFFRYTRGNSCADAIDLGTMYAGTQITHFNNNTCYNNNFPNSPGNDVFYSFTLTGPLGINASLCGVNGAQFDSQLYLLNPNCTVETSNNDGCGNQSTVSYYLCQPGTYFLVVDGNTANAQGTFTLNLTEDTNFTFRAPIVKGDVLCFGADDGWAKTNVNGGFPPYSYLWSSGTGGTTTDSVYGLAPGVHSVTVTDFKGCTVTESVTITEPTPLQVSLSATNVQCSGYTDGTATAIPSGGTPPYTYLWITFPLQATQTAVALGAGTYSVNVIDDNGCVITDSVTIGTNTQIILTLDTVRNVTCNGVADGYINLSLAGGNLPYTYNWSHGPTTEDVANLAPGQYSVTAYDQDSCFVIGIYNITEPTLLETAIIDTLQLSCNGGSDGIITTITNGGTPPYTYLWSNGRTNPNLLNVSAGTYTLTVTDAQGCTTITTQTLNEPAPLNIIWTTQNPTCFAQTDGFIELAVTGGTTPYTYAWTNAETTKDIYGLGDGVYGVLITDSNSCLYFDFAVLFTDPKVEVTVASTTNADCNGNATGAIALTVSGGTGVNYTYNWSNPAVTGQNPTNLPAGTYAVTVTDPNGCSDSTSVTIAEPGTLTATITNTVDVSCSGGSDGAISVDVTGGTQPYTYLWTNGSSNEDLVNLPAGFYQLSVRDAQNCVSASANTAIIEPQPLATFLSGTNPGCPGLANGSIVLIASGGTPPYTYLWSNGATTPNLSNVGSGTYTAIVTDVQGCVKTDTITLSNASEIIAVATIVDLPCNGTADGSIDLAVTGGTQPYTFNWSPANANSNNITGLSGGLYDVTITDVQGCSATFSYEVQEATALSLTINTTDVTCFGDEDGMATTTLNGGTPNYIYNWSDGQNTVVANSLGAGPISVTITDGNNCSVTASGNINGPAQLTVTIDSLFNVSCYDGYDGRLYLNATGGTPNYIYSVQNNVFQGSPSFADLEAGDYTVLVLDTNNCRAILPFTITEPADWEVYFDDPYVFTSRGGSVTLEPKHTNTVGIASYQWSPADGLSCTDCINPSASPLETTTYTVSLIDSNGCESSMQTAVVIKNRYEIFFPNAFSPNGDGRNDTWLPIDFSATSEIDIQIFNRWGEKVYETNDILKGWDGTYKGQLLSPDSYLFNVKGLFRDGKEFSQTGTVALVR